MSITIALLGIVAGHHELKYKTNYTKLCYNVNMLARIKEFWKQNEAKIVLSAGLLLVAAISFEFGLIQGNKSQISPLIIEKAVSSQAAAGATDAGSPSEAQNLAQEASSGSGDTNTLTPPNSQKCAFVGSKNSNKYHLPSCRWAKQIKPENQVCFASAADALAKNYQPDKNCIK